MRKYIEYISDLLFLHDCVIIPDFGGFICNYRSAYIDEADNAIHAPSKDILFNRNLTHNDGLLVNWITCKEGISYEKATKQVALFCEELKIKLNQRQHIAFGDIGVFYMDRRFNIIFESGKSNFLADCLGMEALPIEKIENDDKIKPKQVAISTPPEMSPYVNIDTGNWLHRLLKYGLAAATVAGIIVVSQLDIFHFDEGNSTSVQTNTTTIQPTLPQMSEISKPVNRVIISPLHDYVEYDPLDELEW